MILNRFEAFIVIFHFGWISVSNAGFFDSRLTSNKCWSAGQCADIPSGSLTSFSKEKVDPKRCSEICKLGGEDFCSSFDISSNTCSFFNKKCSSTKTRCKTCRTWNGKCPIPETKGNQMKRLMPVDGFERDRRCNGSMLYQCLSTKPVATSKAKDIIGCQQACRKKSTCKLFVFNSISKSCRLYDKDEKEFLKGCQGHGSTRSCRAMIPDKCDSIRTQCINKDMYEVIKNLRTYEDCKKACLLGLACEFFMYEGKKKECKLYKSNNAKCSEVVMPKSTLFKICNKIVQMSPIVEDNNTATTESSGTSDSSGSSNSETDETPAADSSSGSTPLSESSTDGESSTSASAGKEEDYDYGYVYA